MYMKNDWDSYLAEEYSKYYFEQLGAYISNAYRTKHILPRRENLFKAFKITNFSDVKCVILGQDPYPQPGVACGLSFSVNKDIRIPASLNNIFNELNSDLNIPYPMHGNLTKWVEQGVLLLNSVMTVEAGNSNSHRGVGWETFTDEVIRQLSKNRTGIVFLLWGKSAQAKKHLIDEIKHLVLETSHPSPHSVSLGFRGCGHFSKTNDYLKIKGKDSIDWSIN